MKPRISTGKSTPSGPHGRAVYWLAVLLLVAAAGLYWRFGSFRPVQPEQAPAVQVRTAKVYTGSLEQTVRLTGATAAERFATLLAPQLRGSRSGRGLDTGIGSRTSRTVSISGTFMSVTTTSSGGSGGSSSSSRSSSSVASASAGGSVSGGAEVEGGSGGSGRGSGGGPSSPSVRGMSMSRTGSSGGSSSRSSSGGSSGGRESGGPGGGVFTGGGGGGGGPRGSGGPGGGGEFMLVLQELVKPGSNVKKGDVIAEFDRQYMLTRLDDYRASMEQTEAGVRILESDLEVEKKAHAQTIEVARADLEKAQIDLKTLPVQSAIMTEHLRLNAEEAEAKYKQLLGEVKFKEISFDAQRKIAEIERREAKIELQRAEANAERMLVRAPMDGVTVMQSIIRSGEMAKIQQGDMLFPGMMFAQIVDPASMIINASVNQVDVELMRIGAKARVRFDAYPELDLPAHVHSIGAMPRSGGFRGSFIKEIPIVLKLDKLDPRVIPDLSVSADVVVAREEQAVVAPLASIFREPGAARPYVFVQRPSGWERREVDLGLANPVVAVIRSGLRAGEVVAAERPPQAAAPGNP